MTRLQIQETATGWHVHAHPSDRFNLDQNYTFDHKRDALTRQGCARTVDLEVDDC